MTHSRPYSALALLRRNLMCRPLTAWYRRAVAPKILSTRPVECGVDTSFEVHTLTCDRDLVNSLWSLKTWYHFSGTRPALVIYAGGPLSAQSETTLVEHFPNCRIIRRKIFNQKMKEFLNSYKSSLTHSIISSFYCALKLFGPMYFTRTDSVLYIDSDILFFRTPDELLGHIRSHTPCFNSDYQNAYAFPPDFINQLLPVQLEQTINAGLFHISRNDLAGSLDLVEKYFANIPPVDPASWTINRHEQTLNAVLLSKAHAVRLSGDYQISRTPLTQRTVSHHFVNDGSRPDFYRVGMRRLATNGFLKAVRSMKQPVHTGHRDTP